MVKQKMVRLNIDVLAISEPKLGKFNSDDYYIYYCEQESLRRKGVVLIVNESVWNAVLRCNLKKYWVLVHFQGKRLNIIVIQLKAQPTMLQKLKLVGFMKTYNTFWNN